MYIFFQIQVDLIALVAISLLLLHANLKLKKIELFDRLFLSISSLILIVLVFEILSTVLNGSNVKFIFIHKISTLIQFTLSPFVFYLWCKFIDIWTNNKHSFSKFNIGILELPLALNVTAILLNYKFPIVFSINNSNIYSRGRLFFIYCILNFFYVLYSLIYIFKNKTIITYDLFKFFNIFYVVTFIMCLIQLIFPKYLFIWSSISITLIFIYILLQQQMFEKDPLTGAYNRKFFDSYIYKLLNNKNTPVKLSAINIDLDDFKIINDKFGHAIGDEVLKTVVKLLKDAVCDKGLVIRMGGDEFVILLNNDDLNSLELLMNHITETFSSFNYNSSNPYKIKFSFGYGIYNTTFNTIDDFFNELDKIMYKKKYYNKAILNKKAIHI